MKKSILPLLILFVFIILLTILLLNIHLTRERDTEPISFKPFRIARPQLPGSVTGEGQSIISQQELLQMVDDAMNLIENDRIDEAEDKIRTVLVFSPKNIKAITILGRILYAKGQFAAAEHLFRQQLMYSPQNASVLNNLGATLAQQQRYEEAINYVSQAAVISPDSPDIIINLSGIYALNHNRDKAVFYFAAAARLLGPGILRFSGDTCFDSIRNDRNFLAIINNVAKEVEKQPRKKISAP